MPLEACVQRNSIIREKDNDLIASFIESRKYEKRIQFNVACTLPSVRALVSNSFDEFWSLLPR